MEVSTARLGGRFTCNCEMDVVTENRSSGDLALVHSSVLGLKSTIQSLVYSAQYTYHEFPLFA